jgi:hypothetical protein
MVRRLRHNSSCGACMHGMGNPFGTFQIFWHVTSSLESMDVNADGDDVIRPCACTTLELSPYRRRCFIPGVVR